MNTASAVAAAEARGDHRTALALRDAWTRRAFGEMSDRMVAEAAFAIDARVIEHDAYCACDWDECPTGSLRSELRALDHEMDRRERFGISVRDDRESFEERYAPFGTEWELEQRERMGL